MNNLETLTNEQLLSLAQSTINELNKRDISVSSISDTYHTFGELYHHRALLFASLCLTTFKNVAWKSLLHNDPAEPMYNGMFVVGIDTPYGQASYHYDIDPYWNIFKDVKEIPRAPKFDGHTPEEAIQRIYDYAVYTTQPHEKGKFPSNLSIFTQFKDLV